MPNEPDVATNGTDDVEVKAPENSVEPVKDDGGANAQKKGGAWRSQVSADLRDDADLEGYDTITDFVKAAKGWKANQKEHDEDDAKGWEDFNNREWSSPEEKAMMSELAGVFKESGVKAKDVDKMVLALMNHGFKVNQMQAKERIAAQAKELKDRWGEDYDKNSEIMTEAAKTIYSEADIDKMLKQGRFNDAEFCDLLFKLGKSNKDQFVSSGKNPVAKKSHWGSWN